MTGCTSALFGKGIEVIQAATALGNRLLKMRYLRLRSLGRALSLVAAATAVVLLHLSFAGSAADAVVLLVAVVVALVAVPELFRKRSTTIDRLTCTARAVAVTKDYAVRVAVDRDEDFGDAALAFNQMLSAIEGSASMLEGAKREAEETAKAKSAFLAAMSHEIRTPMNAVMGMAQLLQDTGLSDSQREMVNTIRGSAQALVTIVSDILDFSRMEAGRLHLESDPFDLRACVEECIDLFAAPAVQKRLELVYVVDDLAPRMLIGDVTRVRQILINLLGNALKFTESGETVVSVSSRPVDRDRHEVHFAVRDTGIGIHPTDRDRIFEAYTQANSSTAQQVSGTGLGLSICRRLAHLMDGRIWVESEVGRGSTFHFAILCRVTGAGSAPVTGSERMRGRQLLVVDDNPTVVELLTRQVRAWGMETLATTSGVEALRWIARGAPPREPGASVWRWSRRDASIEPELFRLPCETRQARPAARSVEPDAR
jgi:signal transduction histidine kinase